MREVGQFAGARTLTHPLPLSPVQMPLAKAIKEWVRDAQQMLVFRTMYGRADGLLPPLPLVQETRNQKVAADATEIYLYGGMRFDTKIVFVNKLDASLATLKVSVTPLVPPYLARLRSRSQGLQ